MTSLPYQTADEAVKIVKSGDHLHWPCVAAAPEHLIRALVSRASELENVTITHLYTEGYADYVLPQYAGHFHLDSFFIGGNVRKANKKRHKDTDARWTKKGGEKYYGYEIHAKIDAKSKLIKKSVATDASVHDSQPTKQLVDESDTGQEFHADSAYIGKGVKRVLRKYNMKDRIIKRNVRGKKISKRQEAINKKNSKTRARVETCVRVYGAKQTIIHNLNT